MKSLKLAALFVGAVSGVFLAVIGGFVQSDRIYVGTHLVAYGMVLAFLIVLLPALWLNRAFQSRFAAIGLVITWVSVSFYLATPQPGADQVIVKTWYSSAYLLATAIIGGMVCSLPPMRKIEVNPLPDLASSNVISSEDPSV